MTDLKRLRELAVAATPGPWFYSYDGSSTWTIGQTEDPQAFPIANIWRKTNDVNFIAACDPQTILAMIERIEKYENALNKIKDHGCCVMHNDHSCPGCVAKDALEKE